MYVGIGGRYFLALSNGASSYLPIDTGGYVLQAKAHASPASELYVTIEPGVVTCLVGKPNPQSMGAVLVPFIANAVSAFVLERVECPAGVIPSPAVEPQG